VWTQCGQRDWAFAFNERSRFPIRSGDQLGEFAITAERLARCVAHLTMFGSRDQMDGGEPGDNAATHLAP
jgi:hypothetical protein